MSSIVVGLFDSEAAATRARSELRAAGFASAAVSMTGGSGSTTTGADTGEGGISGWFKSLFGDDDAASRSADADRYGEALRRGGYGVSVQASDDAEVDRAESVLNRCGAVDIDEQSRGWTGASVGGAAEPDAGQPRKLQALEEELTVGKRAVARGGVRVFSRITEVPVSETVRLREERADVKWIPVDRPATEADFAAFKEGSIEVRESAEEAVVGKTARVVGEVSIGKTVTEREETVRDTVRKTTIDVERIDGGDAVGSTSVSGNADFGTNGSPNRDPLSGEPGAHPVGTAVGAAAGGMAAGAVVGTVAGPVGTAVGAAVGAVAGGLAGKGAAEAVDPTTPGARPSKKTP